MKVWLVVEPKASDELMEGGLDTAMDLISYCARVSNPANEFNKETADKLIRYLMKHKHWSPLEMVSCTLGIETTRDIARQLLRHRSMSFQEFSQRYADPQSLEAAFVIREARLQDTKNRQNSIETDDARLQSMWAKNQQHVIANAKAAYDWAISNGIAKEQARCVLPEGNTVSRLFANATLRSWIHYIELRSGNGTQLEHIELARAVATAISKVFPMAHEFVEQQEETAEEFDVVHTKIEPTVPNDMFVSAYYCTKDVKGSRAEVFVFGKNAYSIEYYNAKNERIRTNVHKNRTLELVETLAEDWASGYGGAFKI